MDEPSALTATLAAAGRDTHALVKVSWGNRVEKVARYVGVIQPHYKGYPRVQSTLFKTRANPPILTPVS